MELFEDAKVVFNVKLSQFANHIILIKFIIINANNTTGYFLLGF
jgi:hypothetical protein